MEVNNNISWLDKVRFLRYIVESGEYNKDKYYVDVRFRKSQWMESELSSICSSYLYVPQEYKDFIEEFDDCSLSFVTFYNSLISKDLVLSEEIEEYKEYLSTDYFPFAKDSSGGVFAFNSNQQVVFFECDDYEFESPGVIAANFIEFIEDYVLGPKCEYNLEEDNDFGLYLYSLGWLDPKK